MRSRDVVFGSFGLLRSSVERVRGIVGAVCVWCERVCDIGGQLVAQCVLNCCTEDFVRRGGGVLIGMRDPVHDARRDFRRADGPVSRRGERFRSVADRVADAVNRKDGEALLLLFAYVTSDERSAVVPAAPVERSGDKPVGEQPDVARALNDNVLELGVVKRSVDTVGSQDQ